MRIRRRYDPVEAVIVITGILIFVLLLAAVLAGGEPEPPLPPGCERHTTFIHYTSIPIFNGTTMTTVMQPVYDTDIICTSLEGTRDGN